MTTRRIALILALLMALCGFARAETKAEAPYTIRIWLERVNIQGDPGDPTVDPNAADNYELYMEVQRQAPVGSDVLLTATDFDPYIRSPRLNRRYAAYKASSVCNVTADGSAVADVYFARGAFTYVFNLGREASEMTVNGATYTGDGDELYSFVGKYGQPILVPGVDNGLLPLNTTDDPDDIETFCAGWLLDERANQNVRMTYERTVSEELLPTDEMPYDDLIYTFTGQWFPKGEPRVIANWYEALPGQDGDDYQSIEHEGVTYLNNPATDLRYTAPEGTKPSRESIPGMVYVGRIEPNTRAEGEDAYLWQFLYQRQRYTITFAGGEAQPIESIPFGAPTEQYKPSEGEWFVDKALTTPFPFGNMPAMDLVLYKGN